MRTSIMAVAAAMLLAGSASAADWSKIRIATEGAYAPWNLTNSSGELEGFEVDLAKDLCVRMEADCEIVAQAWDGIIPALQDGRYDAIMAGMSITEERRKVITFSRYYAATPARFVVLTDSDAMALDVAVENMNLDEISAEEQVAIDALVAQFSGKTVGVQTSTTHENFLRAHLEGEVEIRSYDTQENLDLDLESGRIDAALASMSYWVPLLEGDKGKDMAMVGPAMTGGPFGAGVGVGIRQADTELGEKFTAAINSAIADGTISKLATQWFGFDAGAKE